MTQTKKPEICLKWGEKAGQVMSWRHGVDVPHFWLAVPTQWRLGLKGPASGCGAQSSQFASVGRTLALVTSSGGGKWTHSINTGRTTEPWKPWWGRHSEADVSELTGQPLESAFQSSFTIGLFSLVSQRKWDFLRIRKPTVYRYCL